MRAAIIIAAALLVAACSARPLEDDASSGSGDASGDGDSGDGTTSSSSASGTDEGPSLEHCGDGVLDPGEECDDGNDVGADGCNVDCVASGSIRWSMQLDDVGCGLLAVDRQGGVFVSGTSEPSSYWVAHIVEPGEIVWQTPDGPLPAPLVGLSEGVLTGWKNLPSEGQGLVLAYDGAGMVRSETVLDAPSTEGLVFSRHARVAPGQDPVLVTHTELTGGTEQLTFLRFDFAGNMVDARVVAEGIGLQHGDHVAITNDGRVVLATDDHIWTYSPSGQLLWDETLPDTHYLHDLDSSSDGSLYAVSDHFESAEGRLTLLVERHSENGSVENSWVHEGTNEGDHGIDALLAVDGRDDVLVAGKYLDEIENAITELRLVKYSSEGEPRWSQSWETSRGHSSGALDPKALATAPTGDAVLAFMDPTEEHHERCHIVVVAP